MLLRILKVLLKRCLTVMCLTNRILNVKVIKRHNVRLENKGKSSYEAQGLVGSQKKGRRKGERKREIKGERNVDKNRQRVKRRKSAMKRVG